MFVRRYDNGITPVKIMKNMIALVLTQVTPEMVFTIESLRHSMEHLISRFQEIVMVNLINNLSLSTKEELGT